MSAAKPAAARERMLRALEYRERDRIPVYCHRLGGGGIFYVEIENDAPFGNVEALLTAIDEYR